jgi:hypothetical protein
MAGLGLGGGTKQSFAGLAFEIDEGVAAVEDRERREGF